MAVSTGVPNSRGQWTKKYSDSAKLYYSTFVQYNTGQGGRGLDPSSLKTYILYERQRGAVTEWVTGGELGVDGKIKPLKNSEAFRVTGENYDQLEKLTSESLYGYPQNDYVLGELARKDLVAGGTNSLRYQTINKAKDLLKKDSGVSSQEIDRAFDISHNITPPGSAGTPSLLGDPISASQPTSQPPTSAPVNPEDLKKSQSEFDKTSKARDNYEQNLRYPENLQLEKQDCIKFTVFQYTPRGLSLAQNPDRRKKQGQQGIGSIILPIPGGIGDSNLVDWQKDDLDLATQGISDFIVNFVSKGATAGAQSAQNTLGALGADKKALASIVAVKTNQAVTGTNVLSRAYGGVLNPNSELLFSGPQLRNFTFTFRMSPRSRGEAKIVQKIIRTFKQSMSVQRSDSVLILKAPNTFGIEYLTSNKNLHPYLTKFKECALTQCNVNYTPDGTYMTYAGEPSMTAYELQLTFQELEPVFNDDYGDDYNNIGY